MAAKTMKAVRVMAYHTPMEMHDVPTPTMQTPLDVIVKVGAAGVCRTDIHICDGEWKEKSNVELPYTIGHENAGWVHEVGTSVSNVKVGDKVILHPLVTCGLCTACRFGDDVHCGMQKQSTEAGCEIDSTQRAANSPVLMSMAGMLSISVRLREVSSNWMISLSRRTLLLLQTQA